LRITLALRRWNDFFLRLGSACNDGQGLWGAHELVDEKKVRQGKDASQSTAKKKRIPSQADIHVSGALRTAYEETMREDIPAEFLDLLGKLE
jgi:hypothetical protein